MWIKAKARRGWMLIKYCSTSIAILDGLGRCWVDSLQLVSRGVTHMGKDFAAHQSSGDDELPVSTRGNACVIGDVRIKLGGLDGVWSEDSSGMEGRDGEKSSRFVGVTLTLCTQVGCVDSA